MYNPTLKNNYVIYCIIYSPIYTLIYKKTQGMLNSLFSKCNGENSGNSGRRGLY